MRPGATGDVIWTTQGFPVNNDGSEDESKRKVETAFANGTVFRILKLDPGCTPRMHRTDTIDYAIIMSGECDMELDDGVKTVLNPGDCYIQSGTRHRWSNTGDVPAVLAVSLIGAEHTKVG